MQVGLGDDPALVALERHPLGEHVVGVGQARRAVRARLVGELDAVLVQQPAGLRQVGDDRLVRVDQVGVVDAAQVAPRRRDLTGRPRRAGSRGRGTSPTPPRSRTTSAARARAARRGARGPGRTRCLARRRDGARAARGGLPGGARSTASRSPTTARGPRSRWPTSAYDALRRAAGRAREEDDAPGVARDLVERTHQLRPRGGRPGAWSEPPPTCPRRAGGGTPRSAPARPRRPRRHPRRSVARRSRDACAGTSSSADYSPERLGFMSTLLLGLRSGPGRRPDRGRDRVRAVRRARRRRRSRARRRAAWSGV